MNGHLWIEVDFQIWLEWSLKFWILLKIWYNFTQLNLIKCIDLLLLYTLDRWVLIQCDIWVTFQSTEKKLYTITEYFKQSTSKLPIVYGRIQFFSLFEFFLLFVTHKIMSWSNVTYFAHIWITSNYLHFITWQKIFDTMVWWSKTSNVCACIADLYIWLWDIKERIFFLSIGFSTWTAR